MPRKKSTPKFHRYTRPLIAGLATVGAAVTAYLTVVKLTGSSTTCPTKGCDIVLSSPYATVFGQPLALFGLLAYISMIGLAIAPLLVSRSQQKELREKLTNWTQPLLLIGGTAMMIFSGYLMYLLAAEIRALCIYCLGSAVISTSLFLLAWLGQDWPDFLKPAFVSAITAVIILASTIGVYADVNSPVTASDSTAQPGFEITTQSGPAEIALAQHLKDTGAIFYGAWWCPHCHDQKQLFGKEAAENIVPYAECATPDGQSQTAVCQDAAIEGYPTWEINGERLTGTQSLQELAQLSGYEGPSNFQNSI